jgi:hypothetical protein
MQARVASFKALGVHQANTVLGITCNAAISISPSLAYHFFSTNSDGPAKCSITLACVVSTANHYHAQLDQAQAL